jgi:hypothetical protein
MKLRITWSDAWIEVTYNGDLFLLSQTTDVWFKSNVMLGFD